MKKQSLDIDNDIDNKTQDLIIDNQTVSILDNRFDKKAREHFHCACDLCQYERPFRITQKISPSVRSSQSSVGQINSGSQQEKDFLYIIKRLQQPNKLVRGLRINVPEMFFLVQGEIKYVVHVGKEKLEKREIVTIKVTKQKEKLTLSYLRKFFLERRNKVKLQLAQEQLSLRNSMIFSPTDTNNPNSLHAPQLLDFEQIKWQDSKLKEAVIIKYDDNNVQVLTENEVFQLMMKRKSDPIWSTIQYVQNYVQPKKLNFELLQIVFDYQLAVENKNFKRALKEISYLNGEVSKASEDYISLEQEEDFEKSLNLTGPRLFCQYTVFKLIHYIEVFGGSRIDFAQFQFQQDRNDLWQLVNVDHLSAHDLNNRPFFDAEAISKKKDNSRLFIKEEQEDKIKFDDLMKVQRQYAATTYEDLMNLEGQVRKHGDIQDMQKRNILAVAGQDISNKKLMTVFKDNLQQFSQTNKPIDTLKHIVFCHKLVQEKRQKLMQIKPLFASSSPGRFKKTLFSISLVSDFSKFNLPKVPQTTTNAQRRIIRV